MKTLLTMTSLILLSCNDTNFKVGSCVHKPDAMEVYKIKSITKEQLNTILTRDGSLKILKNSSSWIETQCF